MLGGRAGQEHLRREMGQYPSKVLHIWYETIEALSSAGGTLLSFGSAPGSGFTWILYAGVPRLISDFDFTVITSPENITDCHKKLKNSVANINDGFPRSEWGSHVSAVAETTESFTERVAGAPILWASVITTGVCIRGSPPKLPVQPTRPMTVMSLRTLCHSIGMMFLMDWIIVARQHPQIAAQLGALLAAKSIAKLMRALTLDRFAAIEMGRDVSDIIRLHHSSIRVAIDRTQRFLSTHRLPHANGETNELLRLFSEWWCTIASAADASSEIEAAITKACDTPRLESLEPAVLLLREALCIKGSQYDYYRCALDDGT